MWEAQKRRADEWKKRGKQENKVVERWTAEAGAKARQRKHGQNRGTLAPHMPIAVRSKREGGEEAPKESERSVAVRAAGNGPQHKEAARKESARMGVMVAKSELVKELHRAPPVLHGE